MSEQKPCPACGCINGNCDYCRLQEEIDRLSAENEKLKAQLSRYEETPDDKLYLKLGDTYKVYDGELKAKLQAAREALKFYADETNHAVASNGPWLTEDSGRRARQALKELGEV